MGVSCGLTGQLHVHIHSNVNYHQFIVVGVQVMGTLDLFSKESTPSQMERRFQLL